ncbi:hypothetical protein CHS0354_028276, partial [Potamilus streckersoni]
MASMSSNANITQQQQAKYHTLKPVGYGQLFRPHKQRRIVSCNARQGFTIARSGCSIEADASRTTTKYLGHFEGSKLSYIDSADISDVCIDPFFVESDMRKLSLTKLPIRS